MAGPAVQAPGITIGTRLTDFSSLDLTVQGLAAGGMGLIVWGFDALSNQMEALKFLRPDRLAHAALDSPERRRAIERQFEDEALVWCHLWYHPCVVHTYGLTHLPALGDLPALELAYAPNGSLRDALFRARAKHTRLPLRATLAWAVHVAAALAHIHQPDPAHDRPAPLVHCDLKPENVLLNTHGWAQLTDLGLTRAYVALATEPGAVSGSAESADASAAPDPSASALSRHQAEVARLRAILEAAGALPATTPTAPATRMLFATQTLRIPPVRTLPAPAPAAASPSDAAASLSAAIGSRGPVAGSPPYMAPEQWLGLDAAVPATDLYAFGVLLFELFAGIESPHPFPHDPTAYLTPEVYAHALATGYDPVLLAWHAAHTMPGGPAHRLTDADVAAAAFSSGPLAELANRGGAAAAALEHLDAIISACLVPDAAARPPADALQQQLMALIVDPCGLEPIQAPEPLSSTPASEDIFWTNLGRTYSDLGRDDDALPVRRRAIEHNPHDPVNWVNLGASLEHLGRQESRRAAAAASGGRGAEAEARFAQARQRFEEALAAYQQAETYLTPETIAEYPMLPSAIANNQGSVLDKLGRPAEAVAADQRALAVRPDKHDTRFNLALHLAHWSQVPDASAAERLTRLETAQREIQLVLDAAPTMSDGRALADAIARALADPAHRFHG